MSFVRWAPTILSFPIGGWVATALVGPVDSPLSGAAAGAVAGAALGAVQWWALRTSVNWMWLLGSILGMAAGSALAAAITGAGTTVTALVTAGLVAGTTMGMAQGLSLRRGMRVAGLWAATVGLSWAAGWAITANVIVDTEAGYVIFGLSGALLVTIVTGVMIRWILGCTSVLGVSQIPAADHQPITEPVA
ncbi:hypothetical protein E3T24_15055 [Cryobacterium sp. TmT2-59]|uniref:hypothetical protein n=1 Tax=Cryobacterium sp. TmT2-59 TaxID=1259264 RepID=UPI00106BD665|nr:hypothetical protein [Cryobacterium sp. TmT2-59]TFC81474.1 hypothetical protein E3T24_15055 [Cryobacterium sp. TmT2-59]